MATDLTAGSIAFTGFNLDTSDSSDSLTFAALTDIAAGTVISFNAGSWNGHSFASGGDNWTWTATEDVAAGTVITMDMLNSAAPTSNHGDIAISGSSLHVTDFDIIYAYVGTPSAPTTFLSAISGGPLTGSGSGTLSGTGLVEGQTAVSLAPNANNTSDIGVYTGPHIGDANFSDYLSQINNPANWTFQAYSGGGRGEHDGIAPDAPLSQAGFSTDPHAQVINFSAGSLAVSQAEGDSGDTIMTFTVERTGDNTEGELDFSGVINIGGKPLLTAGDFGQPLTFSGSIADGATSGTVTIRIAGDTTFENNETFTLLMTGASNASHQAVLGDHTQATGTIVNDDAGPKIAFTGINSDGGDALSFATFTDIAAGTVIRFHGNADGSTADWSWTASENIAAGSVITMDGLSSGAATSNHGTIAFTSGTKIDMDNFGSSILAYVGDAGQPTGYLTAIALGSLGNLSNIGLIAGTNALQLPISGGIAEYTGPRVGFTSYDAYIQAINNPANWHTDVHAADGKSVDLPFPTYGFSIDQTAQQVDFAASSLQVIHNEGNAGTSTTFTFTVERTNGTTGDLHFTVGVEARNVDGVADAADFGGTLPVVSGVIADGQSSTTVSITVTGDSLYEANEIFNLMFQSASNTQANVVIGTNTTAVGTITNEDAEPGEILAGQVVTVPLTLVGTDSVIIDAGAKLDVSGQVLNPAAITSSSGNGTVDIAGDLITTNQLAGIAVLASKNTGTLTITVRAGATDFGEFDMHKGAVTSVINITNSGTISSHTKTIEMGDATAPGQEWIHNLAGGVITSDTASNDVIRGGQNTEIDNAGTIISADDSSPIITGSDAINFQSKTGGVVHNETGGLIEGSHHAITGNVGLTVTNDAGATLIGRNGSGVNIDNKPDVANTVHVTNHGDIFGESAGYTDSDGDAIDVDGLLQLDNYGNIKGLGANGYHDGTLAIDANISEGIAIGAGSIHNYQGALIYGYGRAIEIDDSSNGPAAAATTIINEGTIQGDGHGPTGVAAADAVTMQAQINGAEAINIHGTFADTITNTATGVIKGGISTDGGADVLSNAGSITALAGSAVNLGDGNDTLTNTGTINGTVLLGAGDDTFNVGAGSTTTGLIDGGDGNDTLNLTGSGLGTLGANQNFENLNVEGGSWTIQSAAYADVTLAAGATLMSRIDLADQGQMTIAAGGIDLTTSGSAIVANGSAAISNAGVIIDVDATAAAIVINGGSVDNAAGATITANAAAIVSGDTPAAGVVISNEGVIQSTSGQAIALTGDENDTLSNQGQILGAVSLGGGDDVLNVSAGSTITGAIDLGDGNDTVHLLGSGTGVLGAVANAENLDVDAGTWSVTDAGDYKAIDIAAGATLTSAIAVTDGIEVTVGGTLTTGSNRAIDAKDGLADGSTLTVNVLAGGQIVAGNDAVRINDDFDNGTVTVDNAGVIQATGGQALDFTEVTSKSTEITITNEVGGLLIGIDADAVRAGGNSIINNYGHISSTATGDDVNDGIDFQDEGNGTVHNYAGGSIVAAHHGITGKQGVTVINDLGGTIIGESGSAVNIDNDESVASTVTVTNHGVMLGEADPNQGDSDGDAVDVDGLLNLDNSGQISGLGAHGYHDGTDAVDANISEGVAAGGGTIVNEAGASISGYGRAIQIDDSNNGGAFASTIITNDGLIQGGGHGPEGVSDADAATMQARIDGAEAIDILGGHADTITNNASGQIIGGIFTDGGDDVLVNAGTITAIAGSAVNMGDGSDTVTNTGTITGNVLLGAGDDTFVASTGSTVTGLIDGGDGNDTITLGGSGTGTLGAIANVETVNLEGGDWTITSEGFTVNFGSGQQTLEISNSDLTDGSFTGTIAGLGTGDKIDIQGIGAATGATLGDNNVLTITGGANGPVTIQLDPSQDFSNTVFKLADDGKGGTVVTAAQNQNVAFSADSTRVTQDEGDAGTTTTFTFTVVRTGGTEGNLSFTANFFGETTTAADFGGAFPTNITGVIPDGQDSVTITVTVTGDDTLETDHIFAYQISGATSDDADVTVTHTGSTIATGVIANDDFTLHTGESFFGSDALRLGGTDHYVFESGSTMQGHFTWSGANSDAIIDNDGTINYSTSIGAVVESADADGTLTINNKADGHIVGSLFSGTSGPRTGNATVVINNDGSINGGTATALNLAGDKTTFVLNNSSTGVITSSTSKSYTIFATGNATINNAGQITGSRDAITAGGGAIVHNEDGGLIQGTTRHAVTGSSAITVINDEGGKMIGNNGSAVNIDNDSTVANMVHVTNHGDMEGRSAGQADSDGDAIDVDGLLQLDNYGQVQGLGANGYHNGTSAIDANISEGVAIGGGSIHNYEGALIYGYGRAIEVDNSSNGPAATATTIINDGTIQGDGHGPTGVNAADAATMQAQINGAEAINIHGTFADTITNTATGVIKGGIFTDGGDDVLSNAGTITALNGSAVAMGDDDDTVTNTGTITGAVLLGAGDDVFNAGTGSTVTGSIDGGAGNDTIHLVGTGTGSLGTIANVENLDVDAGSWTLGSLAGVSNIDIANGATVTSPIVLSSGVTLTVEAGGTVSASSSASPVTWTGGTATLDNRGTISSSVATKNAVTGSGTGNFTIDNEAGATIMAANKDGIHVEKVTNGVVTIDNYGTIESTGTSPSSSVDHNGQAIDFAGITAASASSVINNHGLIQAADADAIRPGNNATINNYGTIRSLNGTPVSDGNDAVDFQSALAGGIVHNFAGGLIDGARHGITGDNAITVTNSGDIVGEAGSGINMDTTTGVTTITNNVGGEITGNATGGLDADGVDVDYLVSIDNFGTIKAVGLTSAANGLNEALAVGGGIIHNEVGGMIVSDQRAITVDDSNDGNAFGATTITNEGTIWGKNGEAISLNSTFADTITNSGVITGNVAMGGGDDTLTNSGTITGTATMGPAIDMGDGNDTVTLSGDSQVTGTILLGTGNDMLTDMGHTAITVDAGAGNDIITVGTGNDTLIGGDGSDTYNYALGAGNDTIVEAAGQAGDVDKLVLTDIDFSGAALSRDGNDLDIVLTDGHTIVVKDQFDGGGLENITFHDGTVIDRDGIVDETNHAPVAVNDVGTVSEHDTATFDLVGNDTDVEDGHPALSGFSVTGVDGIDLSNDAASAAFSIVDGKLQFDGGDIFGALNDGDHATVTIDYTAQDSAGAQTHGQFVLTVDGVTDLNPINGTSGSDVLFDTKGDDHIVAGDGNDIISTMSGSDVVDAGAGNDVVTAVSGNATVNGGDGNDTLIGGVGNTVLNGDAGNDTIIGGSGNEVLNGGAGNDTIIASGGNDRIIGGQGNDQLFGGAGSDTFVFKPGDGQDTVFDFQASGSSHDVVEVDSHSFADFNALMNSVHDTSAGAQLQYADGSTLTFSGVNKAHLMVDDFHFA